MKKYLLVMTTVSSLKEGETLAEMLLEKRLVACVNMSSEMLSLYHWEGKLCKEKEYQLFMKTEANYYHALEKALLNAHSYKTPEIIALPITHGSKAYLNWVTGSLQKNV